MPSKTAKQARFMRAVAHGWKPKRAKAPPLSVAREFVNADKKRKSRAMGGAITAAARRGTPLAGGFAKPMSGVLGAIKRQLPTRRASSRLRPSARIIS